MKHAYAVFLLLIASAAHSQTEEHPIDIQNTECHEIESNQTTPGMIQCEFDAQQAWDAEMNKYYDLLLDTLSEESGKLLKESQAAWVDYNQKEQAFSRSLYYSDMDGTLWYVVNAGREKDIVRSRALELKDYYELFTFDDL